MAAEGSACKWLDMLEFQKIFGIGWKFQKEKKESGRREKARVDCGSGRDLLLEATNSVIKRRDCQPLIKAYANPASPE